MNSETVRQLADTGVDAPFWHGLDDGVVRLPQCPACDRWVWPAQPSCPSCLHAELAWREIDPVGIVYSWTRTWYPFVAVRAEQLPYVVVLAELPAAGNARVLGVYAGASDDELVVGETVRGQIVAPSDRTYGLTSLAWARDATHRPAPLHPGAADRSGLRRDQHQPHRLRRGGQEQQRLPCPL